MLIILYVLGIGILAQAQKDGTCKDRQGPTVLPYTASSNSRSQRIFSYPETLKSHITFLLPSFLLTYSIYRYIHVVPKHTSLPTPGLERKRSSTTQG
ncbi:hypothetical protein BDQ17DRAFT_110880 [Cyathus striatus]|nr:hypothetical protein BDQ17DRAFT_110880 [Cyathus striatus]